MEHLLLLLTHSLKSHLHTSCVCVAYLVSILQLLLVHEYICVQGEFEEAESHNDQRLNMYHMSQVMSSQLSAHGIHVTSQQEEYANSRRHQLL